MANLNDNLIKVERLRRRTGIEEWHDETNLKDDLIDIDLNDHVIN